MTGMGIMSSPALLDMSPQRRPLGELSSTNIPTPDASPSGSNGEMGSRKRQKVVHVFDDTDCVKPVSQFKLPRKFVASTCRQLVTTRLSPYITYNPWQHLQGEALSFVSRPIDIDPLTTLSPWFGCEAQGCLPYSIASSKTSNRVAIGMRAGHVCISKSSQRIHQRPEGAFRQVTDGIIADLSMSYNDQYMAAAGLNGCVCVFDLASHEPVLSRFKPGTRIKQAKFHPNNCSLLVSGDNHGNIELLDMRVADNQQPQVKFENAFNKPEKVKGLDRTGNIGLTSMTWIDNLRIAGSCESHSMLKTWDLRKTSKQSSISTRPASQPRHFGVTSIDFDPVDNKLWSLCRDGHVYSYNAFNLAAGVVDKLSAPQLQVESYSQQLAVVQANKEMSGSYVAVGGGSSKSVIMFAKPDRIANATVQSATVLLQNGHSADISKVCATSNGVASISDDGTARYWSLDDILADEYNINPVAGAAWAERPPQSCI